MLARSYHPWSYTGPHYAGGSAGHVLGCGRLDVFGEPGADYLKPAHGQMAGQDSAHTPLDSDAGIAILSIVGVYVLNGSEFDLILMLIFGIVGFLMRKTVFPWRRSSWDSFWEG